MDDTTLPPDAPATPDPQPVRYVTYNEAGALDGCYLQVPPDAHATCMIVIDETAAEDWPHYRANAARDGVEQMPPAPPPLPQVIDYVGAVQSMLDAKARERRYDNILSACTYATSTKPKFHAEGQACVAWRDAVWDKCYELMDQVDAGTLAQPTVTELLAMLPAIAWPA